MLCIVKRFCSVQFSCDSAQELGVGRPSPTPLVVRRGSDIVLHVRAVKKPLFGWCTCIHGGGL